MVDKLCDFYFPEFIENSRTFQKEIFCKICNKLYRKIQIIQFNKSVTNNKCILDRAKRASLSNNKIHHAGFRSVPRHRKRRKRDEAREPSVQNRVPGKALGCNFSRYIRDESRNEKRKDLGRKGRRKAREKSQSRISVHRERRSCLMAGRRITRKGFSNFRNPYIVSSS